MSSSYFYKEASKKLAEIGLTANERPDGQLDVLLDGKPQLAANLNGTGVYRDSYINTRDAEKLYTDALNILAAVREYAPLMEKALQSDESYLTSRYRLLFEYNGHVLAGAEREKSGCHFVTWKRDADGKGVSSGHYFEDKFTEAKQDFALRSNLLRVEMGFIGDVERLTEIYRALDFYENERFGLSSKQEDAVRAVKASLENIIPGVKDKLEMERSGSQEEGPQMNM